MRSTPYLETYRNPCGHRKMRADIDLCAPRLRSCGNDMAHRFMCCVQRHMSKKYKEVSNGSFSALRIPVAGKKNSWDLRLMPAKNLYMI